MNWLKQWLRVWLGIERQERQMALWTALVSNHSDDLKELDSWRQKLTEGLRGKASQVRRTALVYSDYETSQQKVLAEFEEKDHGVRG